MRELSVYRDVDEFNEKVIGHPFPETPRVLRGERLEFASKHLWEELKEFHDASLNGDVGGAYDALLDMIYVAIGRIREMGLPMAPGWREVHRANMEKRRGNVAKRPGSLGHDAVKPAGWKAPDHGWVTDWRRGADEQKREVGASPALGAPYAATSPGGAMKFSGNKVRLSLNPFEALVRMARAFTHGEPKYAAWNHALGRPWSHYVDAAMRHLGALGDGELADAESGLEHLDLTLAELAMLAVQMREHPELNDLRPASARPPVDLEMPSGWRERALGERARALGEAA